MKVHLSVLLLAVLELQWSSALAAVNPVGHTCPEGHTAFGEKSDIHCYFPSFKDGEDAVGNKNWLDARNYCRELSKKYPTYNYDLISLQNEDEYNFILNTEWSEVYKKWKAQFGIWIGLNDRDEEGTWTWSDGASLNYANPNPTAHTSPWRKGEPSQPYGDEDCVRTYGFEGLTDRDCNKKMSFICEGQKDMWSSWSDWSIEDGTKTRTRTCSVDGKCPGDSQQTKKCDLPDCGMCPEGQAAFGASSDIHCYFPSFKDGEDAVGNKNWLDARNYCKELSKKYSTYNYDLVSLQNEAEYNFILNTEWSEVYKKWKAQFGIWVGLNDRDEEGKWIWSDGALLNYANPNPTAQTPPWRKGEPSQPYGDEDCVRTYGFEGLTDRDCNKKMSFICKGQKVMWSSWSDWSVEDGTKTRTRTCSVDGKCPGDNQHTQKCDLPDCGMCPEGQTAFGASSDIHCYFPSFKDGEDAIGNFNWLDARNYCRELSKKYATYKYDLVSLQNEDEYNFILNTEWSEVYKKWKAQFGIWIGMNDRDEEGKWTWSDGASLNYANPNPTAHTPPWRKGEPSQPYGDEDCVRTYGFEGLTDRECNKKMSFICEGQKDSTVRG